MFPGTRSLSTGVVRRALSLFEGGGRLLARASDALGENLRVRLTRQDPVLPTEGRDAQLATFVANHLHLSALMAEGCRAIRSLGFGVGEYNHLVHIEALPFEEAVRLVDARGRAFERGRGLGVSAIVDGVGSEPIREVVAQAPPGVELSASLGPLCHEIAGPRRAVRAATRTLVEHRGAEVRPRFGVGPVGSGLFEPVAMQLEPALQAAPWRQPRHEYFPNARGAPVARLRAQEVVLGLRAQVHRPLQWARSIDWIANRLPGATLVEVGPGRELTEQSRRGWPWLRRVCTGGQEDAQEGFAAAVRRLRSAA